MKNKQTILIVDDTPENLRVLGHLLEVDYEVRIALNGMEALKTVQESIPDLILLDILMPGMGGYEVCRKLKANTDFKMIPVIFISALGMSEQKIEAFHEGAVDYITKPFSTEEVLARVRTHLQLSKMEELKHEITERKKAEQELMQNIHELKATEEELQAVNDALRENIAELEIAKTRAEESDTLKTAFLANMSHEIRTPMNAIMGFSELLDFADMPFEKRQQFTKIIKDRSKDLLGIINDILDISKIESHTLKIVETKGNLCDNLVEIREFFEIRNEEIDSKPIKYEMFNQLTNEQCYIETDFERIKQVLINLVDNAFKFTAAGKIHLGCQLKDDRTLQFSVSDTGIGIPKDKIQIIFERFRQIEEAYMTRDYGGAGLGLSICKGILDLMQGTIWVESELGKGSTFCFTIPYKPTHINITVQPKFDDSSIDFSNKTILIVEDMDFNQAYLKELLEETNAKLLFASNGTIALDIFKGNSNIDIVLMDIRLPDIHGLDLTKMMLSERANTKIIAQTAYASSDDKSKCFEAGCIDFISKPISQKGLLEMLSNYLNP